MNMRKRDKTKREIGGDSKMKPRRKVFNIQVYGRSHPKATLLHRGQSRKETLAVTRFSVHKGEISPFLWRTWLFLSLRSLKNFSWVSHEEGSIRFIGQATFQNPHNKYKRGSVLLLIRVFFLQIKAQC